MTTRTGLDAQVGVAEESTVGTFVAPTDYFPFLDEGMEAVNARIDSDAIRAGRTILDSDDWAAGARTVSGSVALEARTKQIGMILKHTFGAVATTGSGPYVHTFTPGDLFGKGLSVQGGRPDAGGVVRAFTYTGCKVSSLTLSAAVDEAVKLDVDLVGQDEDTGQTLGTFSDPDAGTLFTFVHGALTIGGTAVPCESVSLTIDNGLQSTRHRLGSVVSTEQRQEARRTVTVDVVADFEDLVNYNRVVSGAEAAVVLTFTSGTTILAITMNCRTDGETPTVSGVEEIPLNLSLMAVGSTDAAAITCVYTNAEATP
ncbi:MAG: hypothetical protein GY925_18895 [Actinomycetia bacterium]|nr:hypothetical protein [Actinomycetes bacterium]